ncbi:MAG: Smr/MutS family protein [Oscillospiraceae bacterium]|jgi:DNA-nicking Smr family endonuclease|nr:Smr/MutS family protein [Oscillospiraceae bacterium]
MQSGTIRLDIHGMTCTQAQAAIDAALRRAGGSVYRLEVVHGYHGGTQLREMVRRVYARHPRVKRLEIGLNQGATELVLREYV